MESWQDHIAVAGFVIAILSFVVAIIGTWGTFRGILSMLSQRSIERKINKKVRQLEEIERFNSGNYLLAYVLQKIVLMLLVFFVAYVLGLETPYFIDYKNINFILVVVASWSVGNLAGNSFRACKNVLKYDFLSSRLTDEIEELRNRG
ncbi:hypothetical protein [Pseudoalteromonas piscicida]|uniref:hypothetical protein n=1 Tax=Pseudoalteromonas piscicida TaxID=43662 RepID=UPI0027E4A86B|nr:hypothetical protein [Pseudoalteromonas piscicida]WMO13614.1 hypothetical protein NI376_16395 [Pseudoalteromonas piscicida]